MRRATPVIPVSDAATTRLLLPSMTYTIAKREALFCRCTSALASTPLRHVFATSIAYHFASFIQMIIYLGKPNEFTCHTRVEACYYTLVFDSLNQQEREIS
ncbi:hypothetical protein HN51_005117, partial [Arachis hypogaea]